jgi:hypothetical protein
METIVFIPIMVIALVGLIVVVVGVIADSKAARRSVVREERKQIIDAITKIKPMTGSPDVRDTKNEIINAVTKRGL